MHIQNIPSTYEELERYNLNYEREHFCYSDTNRLIGEATRKLFPSWFPGFLRPVTKLAVHALLDETLLAFGFEHPPQPLRWAVEVSLNQSDLSTIKVVATSNNFQLAIERSLRQDS